MPRRLRTCAILFAFLAAIPSTAAILPDQFAGAAKTGAKGLQPPDAALFEEYGFEEAERAAYGPTTISAWRFRDSTGALSAWQFLRPAGAKPLESKLDKFAVRTAGGALFLHGNFVLQFDGKTPPDEQLPPLYGSLAKLDISAIPVFSTYLPSDGLIPNSERFISGPTALERFMPKVPPSAVAFHLSAEGQYGRYQTKAGEMAVAIFNYPTPTMARERAATFQKIGGVLAKRTGPMVAVIPDPPDPDAAERVLARITYQSTLTMNQQTPSQEARGFAKAMLDMFMLAGIIIALAILSGAVFAVLRIASRGGARATGEEMIALHITDQRSQ